MQSIASINRGDGLILKDLCLTTALKCVPPGDKPTLELKTCFNFFNSEINLLKNITIIIALGKIAYDACVNYYKQKYDIKIRLYFWSDVEINYLIIRY